MIDASGYRNPEAPGSEARESFGGRRLRLRGGEVLTNVSTAPQAGRRNGFTLVELLVALVIMASLVAVASVSVETTQNKARADKTAAIGRQVVEDLERSDGLSFVSDFGRLPENAEEVKFLFSQEVLDAELAEPVAAAHQTQILELPTSPTPALPAGGDYQKFKDVFGTLATAPTMGVGWRGPYSLVTELRKEEGEPPEFLDAWKNEWEVLFDGGALSGLRSRGRDGQAGGTDWQDQDLDFPLRRTPASVEFQGQVFVRDRNGNEYNAAAQFDDIVLKIVYFTPDFPSASNFAANPATGNVATVEFTCTWNGAVPVWEPKHPSTRTEEASGNPFLFHLDGLTSGRRVFFVYALGTPIGGGQTHYACGARLVHVQAGANYVEFRLNEIH